MNIYNVADLLTGLVEAIMMIMLCETFCIKRKNLSFGIYAMAVIAVTVMINISNKVFNFGMLNVVIMILSFFGVSFLYKSKVATKAIIAVLQYLILVITEVLVLFSVTLIFGLTVSEAINTNTYRLLGIIVSKMLAFLVVTIIRYKYQKNNYMNTSYWILFFFMFLTSVATMFLIFKLSYDIERTDMYNLSVLSCFGLLFSTIFALYLYEHITKQTETIKQQEQYEHHLKTQLKHLDDILITQKQIKKFKHDFGNFQIGLSAYLNNNDVGGAKNYLRDLNKKISLEKNIIETGNTALDAILSTKIALAESKGIVVHKKIQIPENIWIEPIDMCAIFGNALDNAIESCERAQTGNKLINISIICKDEVLLCKIANTVSIMENSFWETSKADKQNHGFGLENIKSTLSKYNANPIIERNNDEFILKFLIFKNE